MLVYGNRFRAPPSHTPTLGNPILFWCAEMNVGDTPCWLALLSHAPKKQNQPAIDTRLNVILHTHAHWYLCVPSWCPIPSLSILECSMFCGFLYISFLGLQYTNDRAQLSKKAADTEPWTNWCVQARKRHFQDFHLFIFASLYFRSDESCVPLKKRHIFALRGCSACRDESSAVSGMQ